jgi:hypothetical protein
MFVMAALAYSSYNLGRLDGIKDFVSILDKNKDRDNIITLHIVNGNVDIVATIE